MEYNNYKNLRQALERLELEETELNLFPNIEKIEPSDWLKKALEIGQLLPLTNEKSKSERVISPILSEIAMSYLENLTIYSGEDLYINEKKDLAGACDFFIAKHKKKSVMQAPIITIVEAKQENMDYGKGQCVAQMYAAQIFNQQKEKPQPYIYGCAVTGDAWKFLKLEKNQVYIDNKTYYLSEIPQILGIFHHIIKFYL